MTKTPTPKDPSKLRQALRQTEQERTGHVQTLLQERGPLIRGTYAAQPGRCGKPTCKCARGEFHTAGALYSRQQGRQVCLYVPLADRDRVEKLNRRYRVFRNARASLAKLGKRTLELADALGESLLEGYPSEEPLKGKPRNGPRARPRKEHGS